MKTELAKTLTLKSIKSILIFFFSISLVACSGSDGGSGSNATDSLPTYTESEFASDLKNLVSTEEGLENVGLRFKSNVEYSSGVSTTTYSWDSIFLQSFFNTHPSANQKDMLPALENYVKVANACLQKYAGAFNLKKSDGTVQAKKLLDSIKKEIEGKVSVANQMISKLKAL